MKRTRWFSWRQKPKRVGFYEVFEGWYCLWDGYDWHFGYATPMMPPTGNHMPVSMIPETVKKWRGLAQKP